MPKPPPPPSPPPRPTISKFQTEEVYDLGPEAENALTVSQIVQQLAWEDPEGLGEGGVYSKKHPESKESDD
ncbi:hypothetical protein N7517_011213 [Penicillium concentricum]|uniref:Uncharacterized protein n=1 Tax=Penicillium concentricum TaxID=293559 RepID=A0A9W9UU23_9EURO|nr:uncharacterized protein N7517_011213 [Penicillium concentricum]KAJ5356604.1 hypothetical protein N7517_011213 [Penicillium concentricum]